MNKKELEKLVEEIIFEFIDDGTLKTNDNYEIEYTQEWLNNWLMGWIKDRYTTQEVMYILEVFENFEYEKEVLESTIIGTYKYWHEEEEYIYEDELIDVLVTMKKIA